MAVFTEAELKSTKQVDVFAMLEGANYLTEDEARIQPQLIPVKENSRLKGFVVRFEDVENLAESVNCDYIAAMQSISETNNLNRPLIVAVDECDLIEDPSLLQELNNVVISPINENDTVYQYCENILNEYMETEDEGLLEALTADDVEKIFNRIEALNIRHAGKHDFNSHFIPPENRDKYTKNLNKTSTKATKRLKQYIINAYKNKTENDFIEKMKQAANSDKSAQKIVGSYPRNSNDRILDFYKKMYKPLSDEGWDSAYNKEQEKRNKMTDKELDQYHQRIVQQSSRSGRYGRSKKEYLGQQQSFYQKPNELQNMMHKDSEKINDVYNNPESVDKAEQVFNAPAKIVAKYSTRPKSVIVRKIAALRNLYHKWMIKAKTSKDTGFVAKIKRMCAKVLGVIDKLLKIVNNKLKGKAQKVN